MFRLSKFNFLFPFQLVFLVWLYYTNRVPLWTIIMLLVWDLSLTVERKTNNTLPW